MLIPKMQKAAPAATSKQGFLRSLRDDTRGNTLALMTAAMLPLAGMVGGALDMSRLYLVQTRVQQACDAGALAGRKRMGGGQWSQDSGAPNTAALNFFDSNFAQGSYGTGTRTRAYTESAGKVTGTASVAVPMTLMRIFGNESEQVEATCDAEMRLPNTDVMFVLDTTGSMGSKAVSTDTQTKIVALKSAVKCFYEIVAKIDTTEACATGTPTGGTGSTTQVRFGFVPYATNVNVGKLLPTAYFANSWPYQSREAVMKTVMVNVDTPNTPARIGTPSRANVVRTGAAVVTNVYYGVTSDANCQAKATIRGYSDEQSTGPESAPYNQQSSGSPATRTHQTSQPHRGRENGAVWDSGSRACYVGYYPVTYNLIQTYSATDSRVSTPRQVFDHWRYAKITVDVSGLKNGNTWNASFLRPIGDTSDGAPLVDKTITWDGCIEERKTIRASTYTSETGGAAKDLDIDTVPTTGDPESLWAPALHGLIYARNAPPTVTGSNGNVVNNNVGPEDIGAFRRDAQITESNYAPIDGNNLDSYFCPAEAKKLQAWPTANAFEAYVDGLTVNGNTYHDIGLIWGARFISPTGIFASENALTAQQGEIERHVIFMTDGETCTGSVNYGPYGYPWFDRRTTPDGDVPSYGCETETTTGGTLSEQVNARASALCTAIKNKNITLWYIWFGASKPNLEARLRLCATPSRFYAARNSADLQTTFATIANQISQLRLTN